MKTSVLTVLFILLSFAIAVSGGVRGIVKEGTTVAKNVTVKIFDNKKLLLGSAVTDSSGTYRMNIKKSGRFSVQAVYNEKTTNLVPIRVFSKTLHLNLLLSRTNAGYNLKRE